MSAERSEAPEPGTLKFEIGLAVMGVLMDEEDGRDVKVHVARKLIDAAADAATVWTLEHVS